MELEKFKQLESVLRDAVRLETNTFNYYLKRSELLNLVSPSH